MDPTNFDVVDVPLDVTHPTGDVPIQEKFPSHAFLEGMF
jgi:hypothetical protein